MKIKYSILSLFLVLFLINDTIAQTEQKIFMEKSENIISLFKNRNYDSLTMQFNDQQIAFNSAMALASNYDPIIEKYGGITKYKFAGFSENYGQINIEYVSKTVYNIDLLIELVFNRENKKLILYRFTETYKTYAIPDYATAENYHDENIKFAADTTMPLSGVLSMPVGNKKVPLVIIIPAAGPSDADGNFVSKPYKDIAVGLATDGFAVFRYNKRSLNYGFNFLQNKMNGVPFTPREDLLDDLQAAINLLKKNPTVDSTKIYLLGHGEGAYFAPFVAKENPFIKGIIMMGANANHPLEMMIDQNKYLGRILPHKKVHFDEDDAKAKIVLKRKVKENTSYFLLPHEIPAKYWLWINKYDQIKVAKKLTIPIFIMQGARDYQVDKKNFAVWEKKLKKHKNVTFKMYEKMNHIMHSGEGESTYSEYAIMRNFPFDVFNDIHVWLHKN